MDPFQTLIEQYLYTEFPLADAKPKIRFEAISSAVFGSKQRRFGPMLSAEDQVKIRQVVRSSVEAGLPLRFFSPWGASKQQDGAGLDIMEVSAIKQLACLRDELGRYGQESQFSFRLEDFTDRYLLGDDKQRIEQITEYVLNFKRLVQVTLPGAEVRLESESANWSTFRTAADSYFARFYEHLQSPQPATKLRLEEIGWKGDVPEEQQQYYKDAYRALGYPAEKYVEKMSEYFSATLARVNQRATRAPVSPFVVVAFTHPIPGNPITTPRVYYRSIPERFTHHHRSPWLAKGYLRIAEAGTVTPRVLTSDDKDMQLTRNPIDWNGVKIEADYQLV